MKHKILHAISYGVILGTSVIMAFTFFLAYFNGYEVTVFINKYGEAHLEAVLMLFMCAFAIPYVFFTGGLRKNVL